MSDENNPGLDQDQNTQEAQDTPSTEPNQQNEGPQFKYVNENVTMSRSPFKEGVLKKQIKADPLVSFGLSLENLDNIQTPNVKLLRNSDEKWQNRLYEHSR